jgi:hypothetical protein
MNSITSLSAMNIPRLAGRPGVHGPPVLDFQAIGSAIQSRDFSAAQSALATIQQNSPGNARGASGQPFGSNDLANTDYQNLLTALKSGDTSTAERAFASLQTDLKAP